MISKICKECGKEFKTSNKYYCSRACANKSLIKGKNVTCNNCGKKFFQHLYRINENKYNYCSTKCNAINKWTNARTKKKCINCCKYFLVRKQDIIRGRGKYCSRECSKKGQRQLNNLNCVQCGKEFYVPPSLRTETVTGTKEGRKYCSRQCFHKGNLKYPKTIHLRNKVIQKRARIYMHDSYIKCTINLPSNQIPKPLIELKRLNIKRKRKLKEITHGNSQ